MNWPAVLRVAALTALLAPAAAVAEWVNFGVVSTTMGVNSNRLCVGENSTAFQTAFGCPSYAPYVDPATGNMGLGTTAPGTALAVSGTIGITRDGGGSNHQLDINGFDAYHSWYGGNLIFYGNGAERARIDTNGSMGIGTSSPAFALDVSGSIRAGTGSGDKGAAALVEGSGGNSGYVSFINPAGTRVGYMGYGYIGGTPLTLQTDGNTALAFSTNATERVRITSSGNVGIGTTAPPSHSPSKRQLCGLHQRAKHHAKPLCGDEWECGFWYIVTPINERVQLGYH